MCNIAGYAGDRQAAPILIEMLRRQQAFDGGMSCGIATLHEGKLHWCKIVGDVDTLLRETDALSLPGTIGIAHTRPSGTPETYELAHPYISMDGEMAVVSNGTTPNDQYTERRNAAVQMLGDAGFNFRTGTMDPTKNWPRLRNGMAVGSEEVRVHLVDYYIKRGKSYEEALALTAQHLYTNNVFLMLNKNEPDRIFAIRTVRPMNVLLSKGETYMATTAFGFPEDVAGEKMALPLMHACAITRGGFTVSPHRVEVEQVCPITPRIYKAAYEAAETILTGKRDEPVFIDQVWRAIREAAEPLWAEPHTFTQHPSLLYETLEQLEEEGQLRRIIKPQAYKEGFQNRYYLWLE